MDPSLLFMSVREFEYDQAIFEIQEYEKELETRDLNEVERAYYSSAASQILGEMNDEKIRWEVCSKIIWIESPVDIVSKYYHNYLAYSKMAKTEYAKNIFLMAHHAAGEILVRFL